MNGSFHSIVSKEMLETWYSKPLLVNLLPHLQIAANAYAGQVHKKVYQRSIQDLLSTNFHTDAQMQPVTCNSKVIANGETIRTSSETDGDLSVSLIVLDFDAKTEAGNKWQWSNEDFKICVQSWENHAILGNSLIYKTKHGLRVLIPLFQDFHLTKGLKGRDFLLTYNQVLSQLPKSSFGKFDLACSDVFHTFRLPLVKRDNDFLSSYFYVPEKQYLHHIDPLTAFVDMSYLVSQSQQIKGVSAGLIECFREKGLYKTALNKSINGDIVHSVRCPFNNLHSSNDDKETTASVLFKSDEGGYIFNCKHDSCRTERNKPNALKMYFGEIWAKHVLDNFEFQYDECDPNTLISNIVSVLLSEKEAPFYHRDLKIIRIRYSELADKSVMHEVSIDELASYVSKNCSFYRLKTTKEGLKRVSVPPLANSVFQRYFGDFANALPRLDNITCIPPVNSSFEPLLDKRGYCASQFSWFEPSRHFNPSKLKNINVSVEQAKKSAENLLELFNDFPFAEPSYALLGLAGLFTAAFRKRMDAPAPLFLVSANSKAAGKTTLIKTILAGVFGTANPSIMIPPDKIEEFEKRLDALLYASEDYVLIDNITNSLGSGSLDAILTSNDYSMRVLGESKTVPIKIKSFLAGTGNNLIMRADTDRRVLTVRLVTDLDDPSKRKDFSIRDIVSYAAKKTSDIWYDILAIAQAYQAYADDAYYLEKLSVMGSFEAWCDNVQRPLAWVGDLLGFEKIDIVAMSKEETVSRDNDDLSTLFTCLRKFQNNSGGHAWLSSELHSAIKNKKSDDEHLELICDLLNNGNVLTINPVGIARRLLKYKDKVSEGFKLVVKKGTSNKTFFQLVQIEKRKTVDLSNLPTKFPDMNGTKQVDSKQESKQTINQVESDPFQCGSSVYTEDKKSCIYLAKDNMCSLYTTRCEGNIEPIQIQEPKTTQEPKIIQEPKTTQEPGKSDGSTLFKIEDTDPNLAHYTQELKNRLIDLIKDSKKQTEIADILANEQFQTVGKWSSVKVGKALVYFNISKTLGKPSPIDQKISARGGYDSEWLNGYPTTYETPINSTKEPIGGKTCSHSKSISFKAESLLSQILGVPKISDALKKATTPEDREARYKAESGDRK